MSLLVLLLFLALSGLIVGTLARLAVPGPDPMSIWRTIALGILGSLLGGLIAGLLGVPIERQGAMFLLSLVGAVLLLIAYRRLVQGRGITGRSEPRT